MKTYYDQVKQRLIFLHQPASPDYWDRLWANSDLAAVFEQAARERFITGCTRQWLPPNKSTAILEGGCGRGEMVYALRQAGFNAIGIDFAVQTIHRTLAFMPDLPVTVGDVANLPFPDHSFDGYWSLGVIEHTFTGYERILQEMQRVVKPGGFIFITFPHLSLLRRTKARLGAYPNFTPSAVPPSAFYQFAFSRPSVQSDLEQLGFRFRYARAVDGFKGIKQELPRLAPALQFLAANPSPLVRLAATAINVAAAPWAGHIMLLAMQKND
ncbi:MAG: methyltransferase domain-containing protein [Candidatus Andersenbacteria bacterium]|nr:methyltransferase domain-containing protein [Candidatus Andersenbacteria bacterium]